MVADARGLVPELGYSLCGLVHDQICKGQAMTNLEIDRRLALVIGYAPEDVRVVCGDLFVRRVTRGDSKTQLSYSAWERFDHKDPGTIYPIAEKYKLMPVWLRNSKEWAVYKTQHWVYHNCPRVCAALAVIEAKESGIL
jgi:hypothetical protein